MTARHTMQFGGVNPAGFEEWRCPICWKLIWWKPGERPITQYEGDPTALHSGGTCGLPGLELEVQPEQPKPADYLKFYCDN